MINYIKKFFWMLLICWVTVILFNLLIGTVGNVVGLFWNQYYFRHSISLLSAIAIVVPIIKRTKCRNQEKRRIYLQAKEQCKSKFRIAFISSDFRQEVIVFLVFLVPYIISNLLVEKISLFELLFLLVFEIIVIGAFYSFLSFLLLVMVYRAWDKD